MKQPLVSILMPVRNTAAFLKECLDSILSQNYSNWELIAVNDHSTDTSLAILEKYSEVNSNITVVNNTNKGIIEALRMAYSQSKGEFITRMDSDDIMPKEKLATLCHNLLESGKGHLATGLVEYFSAADLGEGYKRYAAWLNQLSCQGNNFDELYKECVIPSPCWMVYRSDLDACQAFAPSTYPEDYDLCFRFYQNKLKCIPSQEILHRWRDSPTRTSRHDPNYANNNFLDIKIDYFLKLNYNQNRPLVLWGAGKKGKYIAQKLVSHSIPFYWICNNDKKIGKDIYGQRLLPIAKAASLDAPQFVIAVAQPDAQQEIKSNFLKNSLKTMVDYFFFC
jgi:glycosyltransferase involved in cell wall biosynthesis